MTTELETSGGVVLPADVFHLVAEQLSSIGDFSTLFNLVVSSKYIASAGAITALYRISHEAPVKGGGSEGLSMVEQNLNVQKWSIMWRTVVSSALGKTIYPYCRHLRMLDLRDLKDLIEDDKFRGQTSKYFFKGELAKFHMILNTSLRGRGPRLDVKKIVRAIGDEIIPHAPLLEAVSEPTVTDILSTALLEWTPRLGNLRWLDLFDGTALANETLRNMLHAHCPQLEVIKIYSMKGEEADHALATFIGGMRDNQLKHFENHSDCGISSETCLALNNHGLSLQTLKLSLSEQGILSLALLQGCNRLRTLSISCDKPSVDLKATQNDVFVEIVEWLKACKSLKDLTFSNILSAPDLVTPLLKNQDVALESLDISALEDAMYVVKDHHDFHRALAKQQTLRLLHLKADPDPVSRDDIEVLMDTLCSLTRLNDLKLNRISDYFTDEHIITLSQGLPALEELSIGGYGISDAIWNGIGTLRELKTLNFLGITTFTSDGIMDFIDQLGEGNEGLALSVDNAEFDRAISQEEQDLLRELIAAKVDGRFEYQLSRDPNAPNFDSSDDSD